MKFYKETKIKLGDITPPKCIGWNDYQISLIDDIVLNYDYKKSAIKISKDNKIIDGKHRYCILLEVYGEEHEIVVKKLNLPINIFYVFVFMFFYVFLVVGLIIKTIEFINKK